MKTCPADSDRTRLVSSIAEHFPAHPLEIEIFRTEVTLAPDDDLSLAAARLQHRSWLDIDWREILNGCPGAWHMPSLLSISAYRSLFPSFLVHCLSETGSLLSDLFIEMHLNVNNIYDEDEIAFVLSLTEAQARCVAQVLDTCRSRHSRLAQEALASYWEPYLSSGGL